MLIHAYKHARLMEESELRVEMTPHLHSQADAVASRLFERAEIYRRWESEHARLMKVVAEQARLTNQITALRSTAFGLVHRRAFFEYLRDRHVTGAKRRRLFAIFYGCRDYANAVVSEWGNYVRCSSSYLAANYLGSNLMEDAAFDEPLQLYEQWYMEYFRSYCDCELAETDAERRGRIGMNELRPLLKHRVAEARQAILAMPHHPTKDWREVEIRKPNGDTQRMAALFGNG
jgi:hypothetical protein